MREILFRAKTIDSGEWVEGSLIIIYIHNPKGSETVSAQIENTHISLDEDDIPYAQSGICESVDLETVGQFTGLYDKNGKRIFEGDIVRQITKWDYEADIGKIYFDEKSAMWRRTTNRDFDRKYGYKIDARCNYEVIGNIYDHPELLGGGKN